MTKERITRKHVILSVVAIVLLLFVVWVWQYSQPIRQLTGSKQLAIQPFNLIDMDGNAFTNKKLKGHWSFIFFGFTNCPTVCPSTLAKMDKAYDLLVAKKTKKMPQFIFISVDPKRDGPYTIRRYLANFNTHFIGLMGSKEEIDKLANQFRVVYVKAKTNDMSYYISHSGTILIVNPKGILVAVLKPPHDGKAIAKNFKQILNGYSKGARNDN